MLIYWHFLCLFIYIYIYIYIQDLVCVCVFLEEVYILEKGGAVLYSGQ